MFALLSICSLVRKTTQDKGDYEEQECERSVSEDWWKAKIGGKRMQESRRIEVSADELSETKAVGKDKCGNETKVVKKTNV